MLQGVAADCNSAEATRAWFDSRIAHHLFQNQVLRPRDCPVRRTGGTQTMQLASYLSTSRHGIFYLRLSIPAALHPQDRRSDIRILLETQSPGLARQLTRLLVCAGQSTITKATRCSMRYDEIRMDVQVHFSELLQGFKADVSENGPLDEFMRDRLRASKAIATEDPDGFPALVTQTALKRC
jgi:hypothetical protein